MSRPTAINIRLGHGSCAKVSPHASKWTAADRIKQAVVQQVSCGSRRRATEMCRTAADLQHADRADEGLEGLLREVPRPRQLPAGRAASDARFGTLALPVTIAIQLVQRPAGRWQPATRA